MATKKHVYSPWTADQTLLFQSTGGYSFTVLAGSGAPTITGGFAKIQNIDRSRRKGYTQSIGFDPITMDVPILFDCTVRANAPSGAYAPVDLERDIQILEGMAGRGSLVSADQSIHAAVGDPPVVQIFANTQANQSNLIPKNVQGLEWLITGISYDSNPLRHRDSNRMSQAATVTLCEYVRPPIRTRSAAAPFVIYRSTLTLDTVEKVVHHYTTHRTAKAYRRVLSYSRTHGAKYKSYHQKLKAGTAVYVPRDL